MEETRIKETIQSEEGVFCTNIILDGENRRKLEDQMVEKKTSQGQILDVFFKAAQVLQKFVSPDSPVDKMTKLLCLGKVQSGKTAFFISTLALAFDNKYSIAYVIGGTKNNLLSQNKNRILNDFENNDNISIIELDKANSQKVRKEIERGAKVILMVLKHKNKKSETNLAKFEKITRELSDIPSIIIDDEGDEITPGRKPSKKNNSKKNVGQASNAILNAVKSIKKGTYLSVTATPQSGLLLSTTLENMSPDDCFLVTPGEGYTGGMVFHDTMENQLVKEIDDANDFTIGIPESFRDSLCWFLLGAAVRYLRGDTGPHSMLVHPSSLKDVHRNIYDKINREIDIINDNIGDSTSLGYIDICNSLRKCYSEFLSQSNGEAYSFDIILDQIKKNMTRVSVYQINTRKDSDNIDEVVNDKYHKYKIYVGGNMLERGITLQNLAVTYIYRTARISPVDTTLQRARWFGYKTKYLDLCRVYMTKDMKQQFVDITNHENFLWQTIAEFLKTKRPLQEMKRVFRLDNKSLTLTRSSVAKTVNLGSINPGYRYDKSIDYANPRAVNSNIELLENFFKNYKGKTEYSYYGKNDEHKHLIYKDVPFSVFYNNVLSKYEFPRICQNVNNVAFQSIQQAISEGLLLDTFKLIKMRDGENQFRSTIGDGLSIKELPESYQTTNGYVGDKNICKEEFSIQIHYVYTDKTKPDLIIPFLTINNPFDCISIKYVTGEFNI